MTNSKAKALIDARLPRIKNSGGISVIRDRIKQRLDQMGGRPEGFTFKWLAVERLGISNVQFSYQLTGDRPLRIDTIEAIARELRVTLPWLLGIDDGSDNEDKAKFVAYRLHIAEHRAKRITELARKAKKTTTQFLQDFIDETF